MELNRPIAKGGKYVFPLYISFTVPRFREGKLPQKSLNTSDTRVSLI